MVAKESSIPLLTVLMPVYNAEYFLRRSLKSSLYFTIFFEQSIST